jgi:reactive intermediate/imine deaminase
MLRAIRLSRSFVLGHGRLASCRTNFLRLNYLAFALAVRTNREMSTITAVATTNAPSAIGPYSQAIKAGDFVFVSGCIPLVPSTMQIVEGGIEEQTKQALSNLKAVLEASASSVGKVVKTTVCHFSIGHSLQFDEGVSGVLEKYGGLCHSQQDLRGVL